LRNTIFTRGGYEPRAVLPNNCSQKAPGHAALHLTAHNLAPIRNDVMNDPRDTQLRILQRQYLQLVEPQQLIWPNDAILKAPDVQLWLFKNLFDTANITSPPPDRYQLRVLKLLVSKLERSITDPEEDVWSPISSSKPPFIAPPPPIEIYVTIIHSQQFLSLSLCANGSPLPFYRRFRTT
jgi:hypothetical protein